MIAVQTSLFLTHLTHDVRFAIYSHIVLPPFTGYKAYAGLWLSCRQLYDEIGSVGARSLRMYLQKLSNDILADKKGRIGGRAGRTKNLEFVAPASVLGASVIRVNFPFELPPPEDSWYRQDSWPKRISLPFPQHRRRWPLTEDQAGLRKHQEQRSIYEEDVIRLISGVRNLYKVSMNVEIYLVSTESTTRRIAEDTTLCRGTNGPGPLASTVLGRLLAMHARAIESHCRFHLGNWMQDCTLKIRTINIRWDFTTQSSGVQQEEEWKHAHVSSLHDVCSRVSYTQDHREGIVQYRVDVVQTIQNHIVNAKQHIKKNMAGGLWDDQTASTRRTRGSGNVRESRAYYEQILAANRLNLQRFGIAEPETPEFDEDTPEP